MLEDVPAVVDMSVPSIDVGNIGSNVVWDVTDLIDRKLSNEKLGFNVEEIFETLCHGPEPLYTRTADTNASGRWTSWRFSRIRKEGGHPRSLGASGTSVAAHLGELARIVDKRVHGERPRPRTWQGNNSERLHRPQPYHPIPDLILIDSARSQSGVRCRWEDVYATVEFGDADEKYPGVNERVNVYTRLARDARLLLRFRPSLRYTLGVAVFGTIGTFVLCDRAGMLISTPFDVHENPVTFMRVLLGLLYVDRVYLGFDTNIGENDKILTTRDGTEWDIVKRIRYPYEIYEKGTVVVTIQPVGNENRKCVMKSYWKARREDPLIEVELLKAVRGLSRVVQFVYNERVHVMGKLDVTATVPGVTRLELVHHRLILSPNGCELKDFKSVKELLSVIKDIIEAIEQLHSIGIVHRDISASNIIIVGSDTEEVRRGVLTDLDLATKTIILEKSKGSQPVHGTMPFIATQILNDPHVVHNYTHDLESLFCSLCWTATAQTGPGMEDAQRISQSDGFELGRWMVSKTPDAMSQCGRIKQAIFSNKKKFEDKILRDFHLPYFNLVKGCAEELRVVFFPAPLSDSERHKNQLKIREVIRSGGDPKRLPDNLWASIPIAERPSEEVFRKLKEILEKWIRLAA